MNEARPAIPALRLRERLTSLLDHLEAGLIERGRIVRLAFLAALAGEHTLLVGPPGTAKSELARRLHLAFAGARYFERLLTRFTVPEELFGPLSISALEQDRYERMTAGFLPQATIAFIDEVFKANSAILNALLTLLNEREFDNGAGRERCPLISVIGATNEVPADEVAEAFFDRFLMRLPVGPVSASGFRGLLELDGARAAGRRRIRWPRPTWRPCRPLRLPCRCPTKWPPCWPNCARCSPANRSMCRTGAGSRWPGCSRWRRPARAARPSRSGTCGCCPGAWRPAWSGRRASAAWLAGRLGLEAGMAPPLLTRVVEAFEAQAALEQQAEDLDYDEDGRLRFSADLDRR